MKSNAHSFSLLSANKLKAVKSKSKSAAEQIRSAYLKAILSGSRIISNSETKVPVENPDRAAAIRYIKESSLLRKK